MASPEAQSRPSWDAHPAIAVELKLLARQIALRALEATMTNSLSQPAIIKASQSPAKPSRSDDPLDGSHARVPGGDMTLFMLSTTKCTACRTLQEAAGMPSSQRLHVRYSGDLLFITEADDLHCVGLPVVARRVIELPRTTMFRLLAEPPVGNECRGLRPAAGMVTLGLRDGYWTLAAAGQMHDTTTLHAQIYSATELKD